jgi:hypothetical protein
MRRGRDYTISVDLNHSESLYRIDNESGVMDEVNVVFNKIPDNKELWLKNHTFSKMFTHSWKFLSRELNSDEIRVLIIMTTMAKPRTNAMPPLNDSLSMRRLEEHFGVRREKMPKILDKLYRIGCYGKFKVATADEPYKQFWILNPYISFTGRLIDSDIARLFNGTIIEKEFIKSYTRESMV